MKFFKILSFFLIVGIISSCATVPFSLNPLPEGRWPAVVTQEIQFDNNFDPVLQLTGSQHVFNYDFELKILDPVQQQVLIVGKLANPKQKEKPVFLFDLELGNIMWKLQSATPGFSVVFRPELSDSVIFQGSNLVFSFDRQTGQKVWERAGGFAILDASKNLAYYKPYTLGPKTVINLYDIASGNTIWSSRQLNYGWWGNENQVLEDRIWLAAGDGIHTFDLETGQGWDIDIPTDAKGGTGKVVATVLLVALTGYGSVASQDRYEGLTSNALVAGDKVYCAGNRILVCGDLNSGKELWRTDLPEIAAHSEIAEGEDHIFMLALGWCYINGREAKYSVPYIAKFDKSTGEQLLYKPLGSKNRVDDFRITADCCDALSENSLYCFDRNGSGDEIMSVNADSALGETGSFLDIIGHPEDIYITPSIGDTEFRTLTSFQSPETRLWVLTTQGITQFGPGLEVERSFPNPAINVLLYRKENLSFVRSYNPPWTGLDVNPGGFRGKIDLNSASSLVGTIKVLDSQQNNRLLGEIFTGSDAKIAEDTLYDWQQNGITVIPLEPIYAVYMKK